MLTKNTTDVLLKRIEECNIDSQYRIARVCYVVGLCVFAVAFLVGAFLQSPRLLVSAMLWVNFVLCGVVVRYYTLNLYEVVHSLMKTEYQHRDESRENDAERSDGEHESMMR